MSEQKKYYTVEEAAEILGISPAEVNQRRERNELHGFRNAGNWKFKVEDVEKLRKPHGSGAPASAADEGDVLLSEVEVGPSGSRLAGTIIGPAGDARSPADSDIRLADSDIKLAGSNVSPGEAKVASTGSDIRIGDSDIKLAGSDLLEMTGSDVDKARAKAADFEDLDITIDQDLTLEDSGQMKLEDSQQLLAPEDDSQAIAPNKGSAIRKKAPVPKPADDEDDTASDDSVAVSASKDKKLDDDDVVLGGGSSGSDVTIGGDSGISLVDPADSGLSLEEPLELAGSEEDSLELGEDDMLALADSADTESPTELKADDEFLLTPLEEASEEDSESGSQVIALDTGPAAGDRAQRWLEVEWPPCSTRTSAVPVRGWGWRRHLRPRRQRLPRWVSTLRSRMAACRCPPAP